MQFSNSTELFVNIKDKPLWDPRKPYYEQSREVLQFFGEERRKITEGVNIGGYKLHPWLYFHINFFITPIPVVNERTGKLDEKLMSPPLDDLMLYVTESYQEAEESNLGLFLFGTRGATKSTILTSLIQWLNTTKENGTTSVMGGSQPDLNQISRLLQTAFDKVHPAFRVPRIRTDWTSEVVFGVKEKNNTPLVHSTLSITNANKGSKKESEKGAGLSPVGWISDESGKYDFLGPYMSALPSFMTQHGAKLVPILSGTGGNAELSQDAKKVLHDPKSYNILPMDYERLERNVPEEYITWERSKKSNFGTFIPGQMSYRLEVKKVDVPLSRFVDGDKKELDKIKVKATDWEKATTLLKDRILNQKDEEKRNKDKMYYPLETADCFLTQSINPFPTKIIDRHIRYLEDEGKTGKDVDLIKDGAKTSSTFSSKKRADVHHPGGEADAPIIVYGSIPEDRPIKYAHVSGFDGYKIDGSDTDSLGSLYVLKRRNLEPNTPCETIECSYTSRPDKMKDFHRQCETIIETWNAECCMESIDMGLAQYLDMKGKAEALLAPAFTFAKGGGHSLRSRFGLPPTAGNNEYRFNLLIEYCKEMHTIGIDDDGNEITKYGVEFIDDIDLLKEMMNYYKGGNFDRITAFSHALVYSRQLDLDGVFPMGRGKRGIIEDYAEKPRIVTRNAYGNRRMKRY